MIIKELLKNIHIHTMFRSNWECTKENYEIIHKDCEKHTINVNLSVSTTRPY